MTENKKTPVVPTSTRKTTKKGKELLQNKVNYENLATATATLENIIKNHPGEVNRNLISKISELIALLRGKEMKDYSLSVRAANAISILDRLTQDRTMKSHIRTMLWQVVSNLEGIRE